MLLQEFTQRVGEEYSERFEEANKLYMLLPDMDKDVFCAIWLFSEVSQMDVFCNVLRDYEVYENIKKETPHYFRDALKPFHETKRARAAQSALELLWNGMNAASKILK